jgi:hypothetical protein
MNRFRKARDMEDKISVMALAGMALVPEFQAAISEAVEQGREEFYRRQREEIQAQIQPIDYGTALDLLFSKTKKFKSKRQLKMERQRQKGMI